MKRTERIFNLKRRYHNHERLRQWTAAKKIWPRLHELVNLQLWAEIRADRRAVKTAV